MRSRAAGLLLGCLLALVLLPAPAQLSAGRPAAPASAAERPHDPFGRESPRSTVAGFVSASNDNNLALASRYLQLSGSQKAKAADLVDDLGDLMDRYFLQPMSSISDAPEGKIDDGLPLNQEHVGPLRIAGEDQFLELVRVQDPVGGEVWLVSSQTLARVPQLHASMDRTWAERVLPRSLTRRGIFGVTTAQIVLWFASLLIPVLLFVLLGLGAMALARRWIRHAERLDLIEAWYDGTRWPAILVLTLAVHAAAIPAYGPSLAFRASYARVLAVLLVMVLAWAVLRVAMLAVRRADIRLLRQGRSGARSIMLLGERLFKVLLLVVALLAVLAIAGVDVSTALAGLGIAGIAVALGAQKTVENILGGIMLLGDGAIAVGDFCSVGGRSGTVEDITLRSVRIRTAEQTLMSIPAGVLAQANIENFSSRGKCLALNVLRLAYGASAQQVRAIVEELGALLVSQPKVEKAGARVRLIDIGPRGFEVEIFAYFLTTDWPEFLALREDLLLQAAALVEAQGVAFATPPLTVEPIAR